MSPDVNMAAEMPAAGVAESADVERAGSNGSAAETSWTQPAWKLISLMLSYPDHPDFAELMSEVRDWAEELGATSLAVVANRITSTNVDDLVAEYVQRFDFQSKTCLYLTAHELGDSRKRGLALVALRRMLADAGLFEASLVEGDESELPDYLPLLFEFLAAKPADFDASDLEKRLSRVCQVIYEALPDGSVYQSVMGEALQRLPDTTLPSGGFLFAGHEKADLEELPYPLLYD